MLKPLSMVPSSSAVFLREIRLQLFALATLPGTRPLTHGVIDTGVRNGQWMEEWNGLTGARKEQCCKSYIYYKLHRSPGQ